jgi:hypothetical protein
VAPAAHTSQTPSSADVNNGAAITTGVRFTVDVELDCAGIAFYVPGTNSGTYTVGLYQTTSDDDPNGSGTGTELATDSVGSGSVTGGTWAEVLFDTPVTLSTGVVYTAARHASSGRYVSSSGAFTSATISGNGVTLLQDGTDPNPPGLGSMRNGVFHEGASLAYPNSTFGAADYFVDIVLADGAQVVAVNTATETDAAIAVSRLKARTVGTPSETDAAQALGRAKRRGVGTATSAEVALPIVASRSRAIGTATETDTASAIAASKSRALGIATETDTAFTITATGGSAPAEPRSPFAVKRFPGVRANDTTRRTPTFRNRRRRR